MLRKKSYKSDKLNSSHVNHVNYQPDVLLGMMSLPVSTSGTNLQQMIINNNNNYDYNTTINNNNNDNDNNNGNTTTIKFNNNTTTTNVNVNNDLNATHNNSASSYEVVFETDQPQPQQQHWQSVLPGSNHGQVTIRVDVVLDVTIVLLDCDCDWHLEHHPGLVVDDDDYFVVVAVVDVVVLVP